MSRSVATPGYDVPSSLRDPRYEDPNRAVSPPLNPAVPGSAAHRGLRTELQILGRAEAMVDFYCLLPTTHDSTTPSLSRLAAAGPAPHEALAGSRPSATAAAYGEDRAGTSGSQFLEVAVDPRGASLGGAAVATPTTPRALLEPLAGRQRIRHPDRRRQSPVRRRRDDELRRCHAARGRVYNRRARADARLGRDARHGRVQRCRRARARRSATSASSVV